MDLHNTPLSEIHSLIMSKTLLMLDSAYNELFLLHNPTKINNSFLGLNIPTYQEVTKAFIEELPKVKSAHSEAEIMLTDQYDSTELPDGSLAFHRIVGPVMADAYWYFSSTQFERNFIAAESNPQIAAHFIFCKSPGGEAYYLDAVSKTMRDHKKPIFVFVRQMCCSAAYYLCCHGDAIVCNTQNDLIGSIGTMISFWDWESWYIKEGIKKIEVKATNSDLKNKKFDDLKNGKNQQFIDEELDPINEQFMLEVQSSRKIIGKMERTAPVLRGETFRAEIAMSKDCGLVDSLSSFNDAIIAAHALGQDYLRKNQTNKSITNFL